MRSLVSALFLSLPVTLAAATSNLSLGAGYTSHASAPGQVLRFEPSIVNDGPDAAPNMVFSMTIPREGRLVKLEVLNKEWQCEASDTAITCRRDSMAVHEYQSFKAHIAAPMQSEGVRDTVVITAKSDAVNPRGNDRIALEVFFPRTLRVTNAGDEGPGSLRQAIRDANTLCDGEIPCHVGFEELGEQATIAPETPLPAITGCALFDGARRVEVSGAKLARGNGFELRAACGTTLSGFTINGFPENGVFVGVHDRPERYGYNDIRNCRIGTDATGEEARPNRLRGVAIDAPRTYVAIDGSLISGNGRSGVFVTRSLSTNIVSAKIGVTAGGAPLPNGASGIFAASGGINVTYSEIAHHRDFGVAVQPHVFLYVEHSSIHSNGGQPIDYGLDGKSPRGSEGVPEPAELHEAFYDAARGFTIVRGVIRGTTAPVRRYSLYANGPGSNELQIPAHWSYYTNVDGSFTAALLGDYRGYTLTALAHYGAWADSLIWATSEVSEGVEVR